MNFLQITLDLEFNDLFFQALLKERNVPANSSWENALKLISKDPKWEYLGKLNEKKQASV